VLLLEQQSALRSTLRDLLRRRGLDVTAQAPEGIPAGADLFQSPCPWDAVVFNATQRPVRRKRWLFGYRPARGQTRLVALCDQDPPPLYERHEVDVTLPYPLSVSALVNAILGEEQPRPSSGTGAGAGAVAPSLRRRLRRTENRNAGRDGDRVAAQGYDRASGRSPTPPPPPHWARPARPEPASSPDDPPPKHAA